MMQTKNNSKYLWLASYIRRNKVNMFLYTLIFYTIAVFIYNYANFLNLFTSLASLLILLAVGYAFIKILNLSTPKFSTMLISSIIIFLIHFPDELSQSFFIKQVLLVIGLFLVKYIRINKKPIINPAAFSFIFASVMVVFIPSIDTIFISWWGTSFGGVIGFLALLPAVVVSSYYFKKWPLILGFLIVQIPIILTTSQFSLSSITLFLVGIMLVEIKTSPIQIYEQLVYGAIGALLVSFTPSLFQIESQILAIAQTNILYVIYREGKKYLIK